MDEGIRQDKVKLGKINLSKGQNYVYTGTERVQDYDAEQGYRFVQVDDTYTADRSRQDKRERQSKG